MKRKRLRQWKRDQETVIGIIAFYQQHRQLPPGILSLFHELASKHQRRYIHFIHDVSHRNPSLMAALIRAEAAHQGDVGPECDGGPCPEQELMLDGKSKHIEPEFMRSFQ